jgi:hypothetical protein
MEGMVVSHQAEGREEPYQAAVGKVASYLEEGENLEGQGNQGAEVWSEVNIQNTNKIRS